MTHEPSGAQSGPVGPWVSQSGINETSRLPEHGNAVRNRASSQWSWRTHGCVLMPGHGNGRGYSDTWRDLGVRILEVIDAAAQFPTVIFTSALVVTLGFWVLVLLGRAGVRDFDADVPALTRVFGAAPVAVATSVVTVSGWLVSLAGMLVLERIGVTGFGSAVARVMLLALAALAAWAVAHALAGTLTKLFRHEPAPPRQRDVANGAPFDPGSRRARG